MKKNYRSFEEAREFARSLGLKGKKKWEKWSKSSSRPEDIPAAPSRTYKGSGWVGWGDFLGTGIIAYKDRQYRPFEEAREFVHSFKLKSAEDWKKWCRSGSRPEDIPAAPNLMYKGFGWVGFSDFLGTNNKAPGDYQYRPFKEAREFARSLELNGVKDWRKWSKSENRPEDIPSHPNLIYKDSGWTGFGDFLGTGAIANQDRQYRPFKEAREFARSLKLKTAEGWKKWCRSGSRPEDIPADPGKVYKDYGWIGFGDFLGTGNISNAGIHKNRLKNTYAVISKVQSTFFLSYIDKFDNALLYQLFKLTNNPILKKALKPIIESPNKAKVIEDIQAELKAEIDKNNEIDDSEEVTEENVDDITLDPTVDVEDTVPEPDTESSNPKDLNIIIDATKAKYDIIAECLGGNKFPAELEEWFWDNAVKEILLTA